MIYLKAAQKIFPSLFKNQSTNKEIQNRKLSTNTQATKITNQSNFTKQTPFIPPVKFTKKSLRKNHTQRSINILKKYKFTQNYKKPDYASKKVIVSGDTELPDGNIKRVTIVEVPELKYDKIRIIETIEPSSEEIISSKEMVASHFLLKAKNGTSKIDLELALRDTDLSVIGKISSSDVFLVSSPFDKIDSLENSIKIASNNSAIVSYAEPDYLFYLRNTEPNDESYSSLWGMDNIEAPKAWDITTGSKDIVVAVIDTGVNYNHPDLKDNIWHNEGEDWNGNNPGNNGLDDDGNGYIDDYYGINPGEIDGDPIDGDTHGTHVSGTIGAVGNNSIGVAGVSWDVKIMCISFLKGGTGGTPTGFGSTAIESVVYAAKMGAHISSNSWGSRGNGPISLGEAIMDSEKLFIAASGNEGIDNDIYGDTPSAYEYDNVIAVASNDSDDTMSSFSNFGGVSVDLAAPGRGILSTTPNNTYSSYTGTSMSCPHVAGGAALLMSQKLDATPLEIKNVLLDNVDKIPSYTGKLVSAGRMNIYKSILAMRTDPVLNISSPNSNSKFYNGSQNNITWNSYNTESNIKIELLLNGSIHSVISSSTENDGVFEWNTPTLSASLNYQIRISSLDSSVNDTSDMFTITKAPVQYTEQLLDNQFTDGGTVKNWNDDDAAWNLNLPFTFYFYGAGYNSVYISSNGVLDFINAEIGSEYNNTTDTLKQSTMIAPMWDDLNTSYADCDIFVDSNPDSVTIRWKGSTWSLDGTVYPVNFQTVLFKNGNIQFNYGTGNDYLSPTIGISSGDGELFTISSHHDNASNLHNAGSLLFSTIANPDPVNSDPVANNDTASVKAGESITVSALTNDSDPDGDSLEIISIGSTVKGITEIIECDTECRIVYTANADAEGSETFEYTISDGNGGTDSGIVTVDIITSSESGQYTEKVINNAFIGAGAAKSWNGDDDTWTLDLPFTFDFYGIKYNSVYVSSNGVLDFTNASAGQEYDNQNESLKGAVKIAPLWDDLMTNIADGDIFVHQPSPNSICIRWEGSTSSNTGVVNSVNFETVLYSDGRIQFNYGSGNAGLTPTVGISSGDSKLFTISSTHSNRDNLADAQTLLFIPYGLDPDPDPVNKLPVAVNDTATVNESESITINVLSNDSDPDGDNLTVTSVTSPSKGSAVITGCEIECKIIYTANSNIEGIDNFTYTVNDGKGGTATATVNVQIMNVPNNAPTITIVSPESNSVIEQVTLSPVTISIKAEDEDGAVASTMIEVDGQQFSDTETASWTPSDFGSFNIVAKSIDDDGAPAFATAVVTFKEKDVVALVKINATYWSAWGGNESYPTNGKTIYSQGIEMDKIDSSYNVIVTAFIITKDGNYELALGDPSSNTGSQFNKEKVIEYITKTKAQGRKVLVSLGGAEFDLVIQSADDVLKFKDQVSQIIDEYGFEGLDIDIEASLIGRGQIDAGLFGNAVSDIVDSYRSSGVDFWLTAAPEWPFVIPYTYGTGGPWATRVLAGSFYMDLIEIINLDKFTYIWPQMYNQGTGNGITDFNDSKIIPGDGMGNFIAAMAWAATTDAGYSANSWGAGYQVNLTIINNKTSQTESWTGSFILPHEHSMGILWEADIVSEETTEFGTLVRVKPPSWGGVIAPGGSVAVGFNVENSTGTQPELFELSFSRNFNQN